MQPATASAPARIDLAGGTLDIWPLYLVHGAACTVNLAIDRRASARVEPLAGGAVRLRSRDTGVVVDAPDVEGLDPDGPLALLARIARIAGPGGGYRLTTRSGVPAGSGLGGSSTLAVAALRALSVALGRPLGPGRLVVLARDLEAQLLRIPTGTQDHLAAVHGGLSVVHLGPGGARRRALRADVRALARRLVLVLVGASRLSADTNWRMVRAAVDGEGGVREGFLRIARAAEELASSLSRGDLDAAARAVTAEYDARRGLVPGVETPAMARVHRAALDAGALAGKVCGAGGGGGMVFLVEPGRKGAVGRAAEEAGARVLPFGPDLAGLTS